MSVAGTVSTSSQQHGDAATWGLHDESDPFLETVWNSRFVRDQIESGASTTNGTYKINQSLLEKIQLPLPPIACQDEFAIRVEELDRLNESQTYARLKIDTLYGSILSRAFAHIS